MSIPSITIRLDFGDGRVLGGSMQQGVAPAPMDIGSIVRTGSGAGTLPTPSLDFAGLAAQAEPPTPAAGMFGLDSGMATPPTPSLEAAGLSLGASGDQLPQPEGDPSDKKTSGKK